MVPNTLFYFAWDTLVLAAVVRWFHGGVPYRELVTWGCEQARAALDSSLASGVRREGEVR